MFKLGEKIISDIYLGDKKIAKVFLGDKLVYQANKPIFLDYISFDGASWIDIDYIPTSNTRVVGKASFTAWKTTGANYVFGVFGDSANFGFNAGQNRAILNVPWGSSSGIQITNNTVLGQVYSFDISKNGAYIDGVLKISASQLSATFTANKSFFVGWSNGTTTEKLIGNIYPMQMYESGVLVKDLRPCIDPNGTVCLYDMVTKKYHYNIGTGTLKASGRFVKSIVFDGQSYIKTGITKEQGYNGTWTIKAKCYLQEQATGYTVLLGCGERGGRYYGKNSQDKWGLGASAGRYFDISGDILTEAEVIFNPSKITARSGGVTLTLTGDFSSYTGSEFIIGKGLDEDSYGYTFIGEVDGCKYVDIDGNLIQDLRPYVDENGTACFKDIVTGDLFYNQGTGTLRYTE